MPVRCFEGLPFKEWPAIDQSKWNELTSFADIFSDTPATGWSYSYSYSLRAAYGYLLKFLKENRPDLLEIDGSLRVTPELIEEFIAFMRMWLRDTSVYTYLQRIELVLRHLYPGGDFAWLAQRVLSIKSGATRLVPAIAPTPDLYRIGIDLIRRSTQELSVSALALVAAERYRDGLIIMLLVEAPIRRHTLARIVIDSLSWNGKVYRLSIPRTDMKGKIRKISFVLSERLSLMIKLYLEKVRGLFLGADNHRGLWPSDGRLVSDAMIQRRVKMWTKRYLGYSVSPHRFRHSAATFAADADPDNVLAIRDLLAHKTFAVTDQHYLTGARTRSASKNVPAILAKLHARVGSRSADSSR